MLDPNGGLVCGPFAVLDLTGLGLLDPNLASSLFGKDIGLGIRDLDLSDPNNTNIKRIVSNYEYIYIEYLVW